VCPNSGYTMHWIPKPPFWQVEAGCLDLLHPWSQSSDCHLLHSTNRIWEHRSHYSAAGGSEYRRSSSHLNISTQKAKKTTPSLPYPKSLGRWCWVV
jgi:hypothetical protein